MKKLCLFMMLLFVGNAFGQPNVTRSKSLLKWLIKKDHIEYLYAKSDAAVFYDKNSLTKQTIIDENKKDVPNKCLKDFLSDEEVQTCKTAPPMLMQTDWRVRYSSLRVKFISGKGNVNSQKTIYYFSNPVFLNKGNTRAVIGESFVCGVACGRNDLLLCELKNGSWQLIACAVIAND